METTSALQNCQYHLSREANGSLRDSSGLLEFIGKRDESYPVLNFDLNQMQVFHSEQH
ncbi:MAG: hypothetical protein ABI479_08965 [Gallionella sp.]